MFKKTTLIAFFITFAFSQDYYEIAKKYEMQKDYKNAMKYYKLAAQNTTSDNLQINSNSHNEDLTNFQISTQEMMADNYKYNYTKDGNEEEYEYFGIQAYKTNYVLPVTYNSSNPGKGNRRWESEFQISLQKPLFSNFFGLNETLVVAYTQKSFWQTFKSSVPFRETNYDPEIFMSFMTQFNSLPSLKDIQIGYLHDSNGRDGETSRSWNRLYAQTTFEKSNFEIVPRVWWVVFDINDNKDIKDYMGYGDLNLAYNFDNKSRANILLRNNLKSNHNKGAVELTYAYPLFYGIDLYLQYFNGYGSSLIDYNKSANRFGVGFSIVR